MSVLPTKLKSCVPHTADAGQFCIMGDFFKSHPVAVAIVGLILVYLVVIWFVSR